jgi:hypothetical protein
MRLLSSPAKLLLAVIDQANDFLAQILLARPSRNGTSNTQSHVRRVLAFSAETGSFPKVLKDLLCLRPSFRIQIHGEGILQNLDG